MAQHKYLEPEDFNIEQRQATVARLYSQGHTQVEISATIGVHQSTVSRDLKAVRDKWLESSLRNFDEMKAEQLAKIDEVERNAWESYRRSCEKAHRRTHKREVLKAADSPDGKPVLGGGEVVDVEYEQAGDPRFLSIIQDCIDKRCRIIGAYAPVKMAETNANGDDLDRPDAARSEIHSIAQSLAQRIGIAASGPGGVDPERN